MRSAVVALLGFLITGLALAAVPRPAEACSPAPASVKAVHPADGATLPPDAAITVEVTGAGPQPEARLIDEQGNEVALVSRSAARYSIAGGMLVYKPEEPLAAGAYTFEIDLGERAPGPNNEDFPKSTEASYTVSADASTPTPPRPQNVQLSTADVRGYGNTCASGSFYSRAEFDVPSDQLGKVGYYQVTFRGPERGSEDAETVTRAISAEDIDGEHVAKQFTMDFEPQCVSVDAYAPDRTRVAGAGTCQRKVCATTRKAPYDENFWASMPRCGEDGGGCGGCAAGGEGLPGSLAAMLAALLGVLGLRRRR